MRREDGVAAAAQSAGGRESGRQKKHPDSEMRLAPSPQCMVFYLCRNGGWQPRTGGHQNPRTGRPSSMAEHEKHGPGWTGGLTDREIIMVLVHWFPSADLA